MRRFSSVPVTLMWLTGFLAGQAPGTRLPGAGKSGLFGSHALPVRFGDLVVLVTEGRSRQCAPIGGSADFRPDQLLRLTLSVAAIPSCCRRHRNRPDLQVDGEQQ
jgi:hypothetical protein